MVVFDSDLYDFGQLAIAPLALPLLEYGMSCPPTSCLHRHWLWPLVSEAVHYLGI